MTEARFKKDGFEGNRKMWQKVEGGLRAIEADGNVT
jgi:hypothetical protein